ncbi:hypothetical protein ANO11243_075580 [Dothideomycetidae sp. 11243]|nr:hypothetical protein ANO11243_075580 [fungal sp. No.11243]
MLELKDEEKGILKMGSGVNDVSAAVAGACEEVEKKKQALENNRLTLKIGGKTVVVYDVVKRVATCLRQLEPVLDKVADLDSAHLGLPWSGIKMLIGLAVSEVHLETSLIVSLEIALHAASRLQAYLRYLQRLSEEFPDMAVKAFDKNILNKALGVAWSGSDDLGKFKKDCDDLLSKIAAEALDCDRELYAQDRNKAMQHRQTLSKILAKTAGLKGMAGTGKSTVARTIAQKLNEQKILGASFFFKRDVDGRDNAGRLFTTLASQFADYNCEIGRSIATAMKKTHVPWDDQVLEDQLNGLLVDPLEDAASRTTLPSSLVIVIDALDECQNEREIEVIVNELAQVHLNSSTRLRIVITSRPEHPIRSIFEELQLDCHKSFALDEIDVNTTRDDIRKFFGHQFRRIRKESKKRKLPVPLNDDWPGEDNLETLLDLAVPLFIFADAVSRFLSDAIPQERLELVMRKQAALTDEHLDGMYAIILETALARYTVQGEQPKNVFEQTICPILLLFDALSSRTIISLLDDVSSNRVQTILLDLVSVFQLSESEDLPIRPYHLSFREYLINPFNKERKPYHLDEAQTHARLAERCLSKLMSGELRRDICNINSPGVQRRDVDATIVAKRIPAEVEYACRYWIRHYVQSYQMRCKENLVLLFLRKHFLNWLEALSWLGRIDEANGLVHHLLSVVIDGPKLIIISFPERRRTFHSIMQLRC